MEHRPPSHDIIHAPSLEQIGFEEYEPPEGFCPLWRSYRGEGETSGSFHILAPSDRWQIAIHDFTLLHDTVMEFELPEYLSVAWYESISGEEFTPYRRLRAKSIWGFYSGDGGWRGLVHGGVPVKAVSIEVRPEMSRAYLEREYDGQFERVRDAFASLSDDGDSPELRALLAGLWPRPGDEHRSQLYYEGKVFEAMGLIVERTKARRDTSGRAVAPEDRERIQAVALYIDDHCASALTVDDLARAACMSPTKFKECFKAVTGSTLTRYVQSRRISQGCCGCPTCRSSRWRTRWATRAPAVSASCSAARPACCPASTAGDWSGRRRGGRGGAARTPRAWARPPRAQERPRRRSRSASPRRAGGSPRSGGTCRPRP